MKTRKVVSYYGASLVAASILAVSSANAALVAHFDFEEGTGTTTASSVSGVPSGTLGGAVTWGAGIAPGSSSSVAFTNAPSSTIFLNGATFWNNVQGFSVSTWIQPDALPGNGTAANSIFWLGAGTSARFVIQLLDGGDIRVGGRRTSTNGFSSFSTNGGTENGTINDPIQVGQAYHLAATANYATGQVIIYVNGEQVAAGLVSGWGTGSTDNDLAGYAVRFGTNGPQDGEKFRGRIDDTRLFNSVLTPAEVAALAVPEPSVGIMGCLGAMAWVFGTRRRKA